MHRADSVFHALVFSDGWQIRAVWLGFHCTSVFCASQPSVFLCFKRGTVCFHVFYGLVVCFHIWPDHLPLTRQQKPAWPHKEEQFLITVVKVTINQSLFLDYTQTCSWICCCSITVNNPWRVIGKPIFMTDQTFYRYRSMWKISLRKTIFMQCSGKQR